MTDGVTRADPRSDTHHASRLTPHTSPVTDARPRALIVEDNRSWQQILSEILTDAGLAVDVVDGVEAAVACLRARAHRLAVVDLSLQGDDPHNQDGLRVLDAVRRQDPGCVSILLTGYATVELAVSVLTEYGVYTCLRKEAFRRSEFRDWVDQALASRPASVEAERAHEETGAPLPGADTGVEPEEKAPPGQALVVEDDAGWRSILSELLSDAGYEVRLCSSYGEALGFLRREKFAVAVVDLSLQGAAMPGSSAWGGDPAAQDLEGYRLLESTRAARIPAIVVSGVAGADDVERAYAEHGVFACLAKQTFQRKVFLQTIEQARAAAHVPDELDALTPREREVLALLAQGMTNKEIADQLVITTNTVKRHLKSIFVKLDVHTRSAAAAVAVGAGIG
jgi:DNA-binding NarL/FixJ family response regulator